MAIGIPSSLTIHPLSKKLFKKSISPVSPPDKLLISFAVMFFYAEKLVKKSGICYLLGIVVYTMLLFATDNVSIYLIYLIPLYSTIFAVLSSERICNAEEGN